MPGGLKCIKFIRTEIIKLHSLDVFEMLLLLNEGVRSNRDDLVTKIYSN